MGREEYYKTLEEIEVHRGKHRRYVVKLVEAPNGKKQLRFYVYEKKKDGSEKVGLGRFNLSKSLLEGLVRTYLKLKDKLK